MHIQKYFSEKKMMSRREADRLLKAGRVKVNGVVVVNFGRKIDPEVDKVEIVGGIEEKITVLFHKPRGISSSKVKSEGRNIFDLVPQFKDLNAIGRLDKESEGLILLSNDGVLAKIITGQDHLIEKEYIVEVRERVRESQMNAVRRGMVLNDGPTLPAKAKMLSEHSFSITLKEGRNHQIRRMCDKLRLTVLNLKRVRVGQLVLGSLKVGRFQVVSKDEILKIKNI